MAGCRCVRYGTDTSLSEAEDRRLLYIVNKMCECVRAYLCLHLCMPACVCSCICVRVCVCVCVCVCVFVLPNQQKKPNQTKCCSRPQVTHGRLLFRRLIQIQTRVWPIALGGEGERIEGLITAAVTCLPALNTPNWAIKAGSDRESPEHAVDSLTSREQPGPSCSDGLLDTANCCLV